MKFGHIDVQYLGHVCFQFKSGLGKVLLTDPFFADGFEYDGRYEKYLSPPSVKPQDIRKCNVIFVSHNHGDHFDPDAILTIHKNTRCKVIAPPEVEDDLKRRGLAPNAIMPAHDGKRFDFSGLAMFTYARYDHALDAYDRPCKFSLMIDCEATTLFYSGDCHELPPGVMGHYVEAMFCWPHPDDATLAKLCRGLHPKKFVLMHGDRFEPGEFICNLDMQEQKKRLETLVPGVEAIIPERVDVMQDGQEL